MYSVTRISGSANVDIIVAVGVLFTTILIEKLNSRKYSIEFLHQILLGYHLENKLQLLVGRKSYFSLSKKGGIAATFSVVLISEL